MDYIRDSTTERLYITGGIKMALDILSLREKNF